MNKKTDKKIHPLQEKILSIYKDNNESLPSFREIAKIIGVSSLNTVSYHVSVLKKYGYFSLDKFENGVVKLNFKNLFDMDGKSGVYVLLNGKTPFFINETENIKKDVMEKLIDSDSLVLKNIKENLDEIEIAFQFIEDETERKNMKEHLEKFYPEKGITLIKSEARSTKSETNSNN